MSALRNLGCGATLLVLAATMASCGPGDTAATGGSAASADGIPHFEYDPTWPKLPLPNQWILGEVGGIGADAQGHIWVIQRPWTVGGRELGAVEGISECCRAAPPVIEFDAEGNVVQSWPPLHEFAAPEGTTLGQALAPVGRGGETLWEAAPDGYGEWGRREHTVYVDHNDFVWVTLDESHVIYKFTRDGRHLLTIGEKDQTRGSNDTRALGRPAGLAVDPETNELFVADGYTNKRVIVFDAQTGEYRRHWGAYGNRPEDVPSASLPPGSPAPQFRGPVHGIAISRDGLVYVADRQGNRIQVFRKNGEFVQEGFVAPDTRDAGAAYGVYVSHDPEQQWLYVNDGTNNKIWILRRNNLEVVGSFGSAGRHGGQFLSAHSMTVDQQGNIYVGETRGRRVQKFAFRGMM